MAAVAHGDVVITPAVDPLSRDTTDLLIIARGMQGAGAGIRSLAEPFLDTTSDLAEIVFAILGVAAKLEHPRIKERTARGRADAKAKGLKFGRKPKLTPHQQREAIRRRDIDGETLSSIDRSYNVSAQTISRVNGNQRVPASLGVWSDTPTVIGAGRAQICCQEKARGRPSPYHAEHLGNVGSSRVEPDREDACFLPRPD
jgi:DNA invertase Pin-like site-specific DNA recombinase